MVLPFLFVGLYLGLKVGPGAAREVTSDDLMKSMKIYRVTKQIKAPDFELRNLDGSLVRLSDYQGRIVLMNFWTTW